VTLRWDDPVAQAQSPVESVYLAFTVGLLSEKNSTFAKRNVSLVLPDGTALEPDSMPNDRIDAGVLREAVVAHFLAPEPVAGRYTPTLEGLIGYADTVFEVAVELG